MSQKEKAKELIEMFNPFMYCYSGSGMLTNTYDKDIALHNAKQASLITVNEILESVYSNYEDDISYWEDVKHEINIFKWED